MYVIFILFSQCSSAANSNQRNVILFSCSMKQSGIYDMHIFRPSSVPVAVHPTDTARLELIIPGEQHFYVRAVNAAERQMWLVALGSSKAGTLDTHKHKGRLPVIYIYLYIQSLSYTVCYCTFNCTIEESFYM